MLHALQAGYPQRKKSNQIFFEIDTYQSYNLFRQHTTKYSTIPPYLNMEGWLQNC